MSLFTKLSFIVKCIFALILVLIIFKYPKYRIRKNCVDMCAGDGRGAIEICLSEKKKILGNTDVDVDPFAANATCYNCGGKPVRSQLPND